MTQDLLYPLLPPLMSSNAAFAQSIFDEMIDLFPRNYFAAKAMDRAHRGLQNVDWAPLTAYRAHCVDAFRDGDHGPGINAIRSRAGMHAVHAHRWRPTAGAVRPFVGVGEPRDL